MMPIFMLNAPYRSNVKSNTTIYAKLYKWPTSKLALDIIVELAVSADATKVTFAHVQH